MPRNKLANTGTVNLPVNTTDPTGQAGDMHYNSTEGSFKFFSTAWAGFASSANFVAGVVTVDTNSPAATDTRTGIAATSYERPFKTINAAAFAAAAGIIYVKAGTYTEEIYTGWGLQLLLDPDVVINGNIRSDQGIKIVGLGKVTADSNRVAGTAQIYTNTNVASGFAGIQATNGNLILVNVVTRNTGDYIGVQGMNISVDSCRIISNGMTLKVAYYYGNLFVANSWCYSAAERVAETMYGVYQLTRSTFISLSTNFSCFDGYPAPQIVEGCKIYSQNLCCIGRYHVPAGRLMAGPFLYRDNYFNGFFEGGITGDPANEVDVPMEISGNVFQVRDAATVNGFNANFQAAKTYAPVSINNTFNKASILVSAVGQTTVSANNVGSVAFPAPNPIIYDPNAPLIAVDLPVRLFLLVTLTLLITLANAGIVLTEAEATALDDYFRSLGMEDPAPAEPARDFAPSASAEAAQGHPVLQEHLHGIQHFLHSLGHKIDLHKLFKGHK